MKNSLLSSIFVFCILSASAQTITLSFIGKDAMNQALIPLNRVWVQNLTIGCDTIVIGQIPNLQIPVTIGTGEFNPSENGIIRIEPNIPNPFRGSTEISVHLAKSGRLNLSLSDISGKRLTSMNEEFEKGRHMFEITSGTCGMLMFSIADGQVVKTCKLLNNPAFETANTIRYLGKSEISLKSYEANASGRFVFHVGDVLQFTASSEGYYDAVLQNSPSSNSVYTFNMILNNALATVSTSSVVNITQTSASCGGTVSAEGGSAVTSSGICWSSSPNPTTNDTHINEGSGTGTFVCNLAGLAPTTHYYVRAFAINSFGTSYGNEVAFTTAGQDDITAKLTGGTSKTWKLLRVTGSGRYPLEVGPENHETIWWGMGYNNDEISNRPCMLNDEWTFGIDGSLVYEAKGDYYAEGGVFNIPNICASTANPMVGVNGENLSAWGGGNHTFSVGTGTTSTLTAIGTGAFIGFYKLANGIEVSSTNPITIPNSVTYNIIKLTDNTVDTLIIEGHYHWDQGSLGGYWRFVLMHYDNPADEPPIPGPAPIAGFSVVINGMMASCTNTSGFGVDFHWDFGDGTTSTEINPTHTYALGGPYLITLTASNPNGSNSVSKMVFVSQNTLTNNMLQGAPWHVGVGDMTIFVGPALGDGSWWHVPIASLDGTYAGTPDDWSCIPDDEFTFLEGDTFSYDTKGSTRNDGFFGGVNGCIDDAGIAASLYGAPLGSFAGHSYSFTPATANTRASITLNSPAGHAAFLGFYKGFNGVASGIEGGENTGYYPANHASPTNTYQVIGYADTGTKEYLFVSVDITPDHSGTAAWSVILER